MSLLQCTTGTLMDIVFRLQKRGTYNLEPCVVVGKPKHQNCRREKCRVRYTKWHTGVDYTHTAYMYC